MTHHEFGTALRERRQDRGLSLRKLQSLVRYDFTYLGQVERGEKPGSAELAAACDLALETSGDLTDVYLRASRQASAENGDDAETDPVDGSVRGGDPVGCGDRLDRLERETARLRLAYHRAPSPARLLERTGSQLRALTELLRDDPPEPVKARLQRNRSEVAALAGRLAFFDLSDPLAARAYYTVGYEAALQACDDALAAAALGHLAFAPAQEGDIPSALAYLDEASGHARRTGVPMLRSWLFAIEAEVLSRVDPGAALRALDHAQLSLAHAGDEAQAVAPDWFDYFSGARLEGFRGAVLLAAGRWPQARLALDRALAALEPGAVKQRAVLRLDLATGVADCPNAELEEACELAVQAVADLATAGYATADDRLTRLRARLIRWERSAPVRRLDEALAELQGRTLQAQPALGYSLAL